MGRFDFASPGAAAVGGITDILAKRKAEERQSLLDELAFRADERASAEATEQKRMRDAQLVQMEQDNKRRRYDQITANMDLGTDASTSGLKPEDIDLVGEFGGWKVEAPKPADLSQVTDAQSASDAVSNAQAPSMRFVGTKDQRERERKIKRSGELIAKMSANPKTAKWADIAAMSAANNDGVIADNILAMLGPDQDVMSFDNRTGKFTNVGSVAPGTQVIQRPYPPDYGNNRRTWVPTGKMDDNGYPILIDDQGNMKVGTIKSGDIRGAAALGIRQETLANHLASIGGLEEGSTFFGNKTPIPPGNLMLFRQTASYVIGDAKVTPKVKNLAQLYVRDVNAFESEILSGKAQLTAEEGSQLQQLTNTIAGPEVREVLKKYGYNPNKTAATETPRPKTGLEEQLANPMRKNRGY